MGEILIDWVEWMSALPPIWVYASILVVAYIENVIPPIPGDMIVVFGGYMAGLGRVGVVPVILLATLGGALGFMSMYAIGHRLGHAITDPERFRWLPRKRIQQARGRLRDWGFRLVAANRFLSGLRSVISLSVGMAHMKPVPTLIWSTVSALVWTALMTLLGYFVGENWEVVREYLQSWGWFVMGFILVFALVQWIRHRRQNTGGDDISAP